MSKGTWIVMIVVALIVIGGGIWLFGFNTTPQPDTPGASMDPLPSTGSEGSEPVKIGVVAPLTGEGATYGAAMKRGFDLLFADYPNYQLLYEDSTLTAKDGVAAITKLINSDKVEVVLGAAASSVTLAMAPIADRERTILFSSISTSDDLRDAGPFFFRNVPRNEVQGITAAEFMFNDHGINSIAIVRKNDEYATNLSASFRTRFKELGGRIVLDEAYQPQTQDFRNVLAKLKPLAPDGVYIPGNYQEVAQFLKQATEVGLHAVYVGGDGSYSPELITIAGEAAEGTYYTLMTVNHNDYYAAFEDEFLDKYNRDPDVYDAYAYEAADIIRQAIDSVGNDSEAIARYLRETTFVSLTGDLDFNENGEVSRKYGLVTVKNGEFEEL